MPRRVRSLGTDGFGRSEDRSGLREVLRSRRAVRRARDARRARAGRADRSQGRRAGDQGSRHQPGEAESGDDVDLKLIADSSRADTDDMPTDFTLPELGENITAGDVVRVLVAPGDTRRRRISRSSSSRPTRRRSRCRRVAGTVKDVRVKQGERVKVGQVVLTLDDGAARRRQAQRRRRRPQAEAAAKPRQARRGRRPEPEGGPSRRRRRGGSAATRSAQPRRPARRSRKREAKSSTSAERGEVVDISRGARAAAAPQRRSRATGPAAPAAPSVRRLARELGVDIRRVDRQRSRRPHQRRGRAGVRPERAGRRRRRRGAPVAAARLHASGARSSASR